MVVINRGAGGGQIRGIVLIGMGGTFARLA